MRTNQKPLKGRAPRKIIAACVAKEIRLQVEAAAREFGVSKSFIQNVALAKFFGIKNQEQFF